MNILRSASFSLVLLLAVGCDNDNSSAPAAPPPPPVVQKWSLDIDLGSGLTDVKELSTVRGIHYSSRIVHGRINNFSRKAFKDSVYLGSTSESIACAISDSGTFSFRVNNLIMPDAQSTVSILPWPRDGFELSPRSISIVVYNF